MKKRIVEMLTKRAGMLCWISIVVALLTVVFSNAMNIREIALRSPGQVTVGDYMSKDSQDLAAMPATIYGQTLREPIVSPVWVSVIQTASLVSIAQWWPLYLVAIFIAMLMTMATRPNLGKNPNRSVSNNHMAHWPNWHHGRPA